MALSQQQQQQQGKQLLLSTTEQLAKYITQVAKDPALSQMLLQQTQPADPWTHRQVHLLANCCNALVELTLVMHQQHDAAAAPNRRLGLVLRHQAVHSAGTLLAWLQQWPEQLQFVQPLGRDPAQHQAGGTGVLATKAAV
jgi:hypothetical protein